MSETSKVEILRMLIEILDAKGEGCPLDFYEFSDALDQRLEREAAIEAAEGQE